MYQDKTEVAKAVCHDNSTIEVEVDVGKVDHYQTSINDMNINTDKTNGYSRFP